MNYLLAIIRYVVIFLVIFFTSFFPHLLTLAHPLGNFSTNHFVRIEVSTNQIKIRYIVDMAEITTFQELQKASVKDPNSPTQEELNSYLEKVLPEYANNLVLLINDQKIFLTPTEKSISTPLGAGNLKTLRVESYLVGELPKTDKLINKVSFQDKNHPDRLGWHEMVVNQLSNISIFNSTVFGSSITDEIKTYPENALIAPLNERSAEFYFTLGSLPDGAKALLTRQGQVSVSQKDPLTELIALPNITPLLAFWGLIVAALLGSLHALSPGHGKTIVAAYLVGTRGTMRHALFLGLTVTITHTIGVFVLGIITLFASQYIVPEKVFPILSFASGSIVVLMGLGLFFSRLESFWGLKIEHSPSSNHKHWNFFSEHTHDEKNNPHLLETENSKVTWQSLLTLGVSGGLLPCPSALVVLLAAIALQRVAYGLLLVVAFSIGLASVLTLTGFIFVYTARFFKDSTSNSKYSRIIQLLPIVSAFVITCVGVVICYQSLVQSGVNILFLFQHFEDDSIAFKSVASLGVVGILILGLVFGLKHATEADHVVAVSAIVSEHKNLIKAASVGVLWGVGHTFSLLVVGLFVLGMRLTIPENVAGWLEFSVSLMIIWLGANAFISALRQKPSFANAENPDQSENQKSDNLKTNMFSRFNLKPMIVGSIHGLAGSAALTLLILTEIKSVFLGVAYLLVFGFGSIIGMLLMSGLVGLPFVLGTERIGGFSKALQLLAGAVSILFGLWYAYETV
jgi:ABC-type nickel/cobalt efflux system permease component RcnA